MAKRKHVGGTQNSQTTNQKNHSSSKKTKYTGLVKPSSVIENFPNEIKLKIIEFLDAKTTFNLLKTSLTFYALKKTKEVLYKTEKMVLKKLGFDDSNKFVLLQKKLDISTGESLLRDFNKINLQVEELARSTQEYKEKWFETTFNKLELKNVPSELLTTNVSNAELLEKIHYKTTHENRRIIVEQLNPYLIYYLICGADKANISISFPVLRLLLESLILRLEVDVRFLTLVNSKLMLGDQFKSYEFNDLKLNFKNEAIRVIRKNFLLESKLNDHVLIDQCLFIFSPQSHKLTSRTLKSFLSKIESIDARSFRSDLITISSYECLACLGLTYEDVRKLKHSQVISGKSGSSISSWEILTSSKKLANYLLHNTQGLADFYGENKEAIIFLYLQDIKSANIYNNFSLAEVKEMMGYPALYRKICEIKKLKSSQITLAKTIVNEKVVSNQEFQVFIADNFEQKRLGEFVEFRRKFPKESGLLEQVFFKKNELFRFWVKTLWNSKKNNEIFYEKVREINLKLIIDCQPQAIGRISTSLLLDSYQRYQDGTKEANYQACMRKISSFLEVCQRTTCADGGSETLFDIVQKETIFLRPSFDKFMIDLFDYVVGFDKNEDCILVLQEKNIVLYIRNNDELMWEEFFHSENFSMQCAQGSSFSYLYDVLSLNDIDDEPKANNHEENDDINMYTEILLGIKKYPQVLPEEEDLQFLVDLKNG